jgi:enamine deaminase RidA (YjgF/YER057c/UK114 family)
VTECVRETDGIARLGSGGPYEDVIGYSRVIRAGDWFVTAGCTSVLDGEVVHVGDAYRQAITAFTIGIDALAGAGCRASDLVQSRMYVVDRQYAEAVGRAHHDLFGQIRPAATMIIVAGLVDPRMLVEVELSAWASDRSSSA